MSVFKQKIELNDDIVEAISGVIDKEIGKEARIQVWIDCIEQAGFIYYPFSDTVLLRLIKGTKQILWTLQAEAQALGELFWMGANGNGQMLRLSKFKELFTIQQEIIHLYKIVDDICQTMLLRSRKADICEVIGFPCCEDGGCNGQAKQARKKTKNVFSLADCQKKPKRNTMKA